MQPKGAQDIWATLLASPVVTELPPESQPAKPAEVIVAEMPAPLLKGMSVRVFNNQSANLLSDAKVDMRNWNAAHIDVWVSGTSPSATVTVQGADDSGNYVTLPDPAANQPGVTAAMSFDVICNARWLKINISAISGTFGASQGFTIVVTPCIAAAPAASGFAYVAYSTAQTATTIKSAAGVLHSITILGGTAGAITVWDNTAGSGTTIVPQFTPGNVTVPVTLILDAAFATGLTFTTAANTILLFAYR